MKHTKGTLKYCSMLKKKKNPNKKKRNFCQQKITYKTTFGFKKNRSRYYLLHFLVVLLWYVHMKELTNSNVLLCKNAALILK